MKVHLKAECFECGEDLFIVYPTTPVDDTFECDNCNYKVKITVGEARWRNDKVNAQSDDCEGVG